MSLFKNDIAKLALGLLGSTESVVDFDSEDSEAARVIRQNFQLSLDDLLEQYPWGFATDFENLTLVSIDPLETWGFAYKHSANVLVVRKIGFDDIFIEQDTRDNEPIPWKEVFSATGTLMYSNIEDAQIEFTRRISADSAFPNHFGRGLSGQLAIDIGPSLITNNWSKVKRLLLSDAQKRIDNAIAQDITKTPANPTSPPTFVSARL